MDNSRPSRKTRRSSASFGDNSSYHSRTSSSKHGRGGKNYASLDDEVYESDEPKAWLGFDSIMIDATPVRNNRASVKNGHYQNDAQSKRQRSASANNRNQSTMQLAGETRSRSKSSNRSRSSSRVREISIPANKSINSISSMQSGKTHNSPSRHRSSSRNHSQSSRHRSVSRHDVSSSRHRSSSRNHSKSSRHRSVSRHDVSSSSAIRKSISSTSLSSSSMHESSSRHRSSSRHESSSRHRSSSRHKSSSSSLPSSRHRSTSRHKSSSSSLPSSKHRKSTSSRSQSRSHRSRSRSIQSRSSLDTNNPILPTEIEPNVHQGAIMALEIRGPVIAEMKENEMFAREAGINFTKEGGDSLTLVRPSSAETTVAPSEDVFEEVLITPSNGNNDHDMLFDDVQFPPNATFLKITESSKKKTGAGQELDYLRDVAGQLFVKWKGETSPALARRLRDFQFAQEKRRVKFGDERPWGILGLYDHLAAVRADIQWAEEAACRRANGEPYKAWFEYVDEKGTGKNRPFFTYIILFLCTGFLLASIAINGWSVEPFSVNPMIGPSAETLVILGAKNSALIVEDKEVWRLLTAMVLHAGLIHYLLNMLALWFVGSAVEICHGFWSSLLLFVAPAVGGTLLSAIFLPEYITVGASAGIFGLIGACLADICMNWSLLFNEFVNRENRHRHTVILLVLFADVVVNSLIGLTPFVDNFAHMGGLLFGFLCGTATMERVTTDMFGDKQEKTFWSTLKHNTARFFGIILTIFGLCISMTFLMYGDGRTSPCKSCDAFSCIAFPPWTPYESKWWYCDDCGAVTADARVNPDTSEFDQLTINCPGGDDIILDIGSEEFQSDRAWIEGMLPKLCRQYCPNVKG